MEKIKKLSFNLDSALGKLCSREITINDITVLLQHFRDEINDIDEHESKYDFFHHQRMVRVISELMTYTANEMNDNIQELVRVNQELFEHIRK